MALNVVLDGKLVVLVNRNAPGGKSRSLPATGATSSTQLVAVVQKLFVPPPSQLLVAANASDTAKSRVAMTRRAYRRNWFVRFAFISFLSVALKACAGGRIDSER